MTILFTDVVDSTSLGERLDPETFRKIMTMYFEQMRHVLERHGGTLEKYIGDAIMAVFGVPVLHEDDAVRALRAAAEMHSSLEALNAALTDRWDVHIDSRTGINTGEILADERALQTPLGSDTTNVAARLEQAAGAGEILIGESTYRLVKDAVRVEPIAGGLRLKGKAAAVAAWRLLEVSSSGPGIARRLDSAMIARDAELSTLQTTFDLATADSSCRLVTVLGVPGVGKTRLLDEFLRSLEGRATILQGRCLPYGDGITFWPVAEVVRQAAGIVDADQADRAGDKVAGILEGDPESTAIAAHVASAVGLGDLAVPAQEAFWAIRRLFEILSRQRPLVVVFDDVHWGEPTFLDLVEYLAGWSTGHPILILCSARPDLLDVRPSWGAGSPNAYSIKLNPLSEAEIERLIENLLGPAELDHLVRERIRQAAEGNPLFVEEILRTLVDDGFLRPDGGRWIASRELSSITIPPTISALLAARLERLPNDELAVIRRASVVGKVFWWGAVSELSPAPERLAVGACLQGLARKDLVRADHSIFLGEDAFRFSHILIRDAAYEGLAKELRAELHERFAWWLERKAGDRIAEYEEIVGYHLEQAHRYRAELEPVDERANVLAKRASLRLRSAGFRAIARVDIPATVSLLSRAATLLPTDDPDRLALIPDLAEALADQGELEQAESLLQDLLQRVEAEGPLAAHARVTRLLVGAEAGDLIEDPRHEGERAALIFQEHGDVRGLARAYRLIGLTEWRAGQAGPAERALDQARLHAETARDTRQATDSLHILGAVLAQGPIPVPQAIIRAEEMLHRFSGNRTAEGYLCHALSHLHAWNGEFGGAEEMAVRYRTILLENGQRATFLDSAEALADVELLRGNPEIAARILEEAQEEREALGDYGAMLLPFLARALYVIGRYDKAESAAEGAARSGHPLWSYLGRGTLARVRARQGQEDAESLAAQAVAGFERTDYLNFTGAVLMDLGEVLALSGRTDQATQAFERARRLFDQKASLVLASQARSAQEALTRE